MALSGELSDLSLAELIEFFCNQRKTGRLKVIFPHLPGYFYMQAGALVDARVGSLSGIDAVYYALTLPNASFKFDTEHEAEQRTIHQPWTQVVLEGLRRMDEGIAPEPPINKDELPDENDLEQAFESVIHEGDRSPTPLPMALTVDSMARGGDRKRRKLLFAVAAAILLVAITATIVLAKGLAQTESTASIPPVALGDVEENASNQSATGEAAQQVASDVSSDEGAGAPPSEAAALLLRRAREARERRRAEEMNSSWPALKAEPAATAATTTTAPPATQAAAASAVKKPDAPKPGPKTATVQVTYDEAGRVTQASGSDPTALRIARQKRFPSGKPGTTTITIPIN
jgi:Domain of unknown function (DUF4388)